MISNSDTPETREIYSAFNLHAFSVRRSVSAKSRDMAGEVIGVLRGDVGRNSGACGAWTSTIENLRPAAIWIGFDRPPDSITGSHLMNTLDAVVTRVLDVRPYRHFWIVEVEVLSWGRYSNTTIIRDSEKKPAGFNPATR